MTSLHVICGLGSPPPIKNPGYAYGPANPLSVFPGIPESQILAQPNLPRNNKKTSNESRNVTPDESPAFNEKDTISSFEELGPVYTVRKILSLQA